MATTVTKTIGPGKDYGSLNAWVAGEVAGVDLTALDEIRQAECYAFADTTAVTIDGSTTDATRYLRVYTPTSERHAGAWNTGKYYLVASVGWGAALRNVDDYTRIEGLQVRNTSPNSSTSLRSENTSYISHCIVRDGAYVSIYLGSTTAIYVWNCIAYGSPGAALESWGNNKYVYSCTLIGGSVGWSRGSGTINIIGKNLYAKGTTAYASDITLTTCASSDTTGSAGLQNIAYDTSNFVNVTAGSEDLHRSTSSALKGVGTNTSGDAAPMNFTDDIDGEERVGLWDVGADQGPAGGVVYISGTLAGASTVSGAAKVARNIAGAISALSTAQGDLSAARKLAGVIAGASTVDGAVKMTRGLAGVIAAVSSVADAPLKVTWSLNGSVTVTSDVTGHVSAARKLAGVINATSSATAILSVVQPVDGKGAPKVVMETRIPKAVLDSARTGKVIMDSRIPKIIH